QASLQAARSRRPPLALAGLASSLARPGRGRAVSSVGRASRLHREGRRFEPVTAHQLHAAVLPMTFTRPNLSGWEVWAALGAALACCSPGLASASSAPMQFHVEPLQSGNCGYNCPNVVVADGIIEPDTPEEFVDFARQVARAPNLRAVMLINSPGGNVVASMEFGAKLRQLGMAAIVASYGSDGRRAGATPGECVSACVYALMGA